VAAPDFTTWRAWPGPVRPKPGLAQAQPSPVTAQSMLTIDRSTLTVDLDPHVSDSLCFGQSELDTCHCLEFPFSFSFPENHLIFRNS
jgi:hypothetical protein